MRVGVDFDHTLACYDDLFPRVARERGLVTAGVPTSKNGIRDHLHATGREDAWAELQGHIYGARMDEVEPYPGARECLAAWVRAGVCVFIVSFKTRVPFRGAAHDLQASARSWLERQGFFDPERIGISPERVCFEPTRETKLRRIAALDCTHFIDDLPEILGHPDFPGGVERTLFDPHGVHLDDTRFRRVKSWDEIAALLPVGGGHD